MIEKDAVKNIKRAEKERLPARQSLLQEMFHYRKTFRLIAFENVKGMIKKRRTTQQMEKSQFSIRLIY
jgi:hypothetical protein